MTEIAADNYNILNNLKIGEVADSTAAGSASGCGHDFGSVLDKKVETITEKIDKTSKTLGDVKNALLGGELSDNLTDFREILKNTAGEINMENSLDLTLARDISDIITQLKESAAGNTDAEVSELTDEDEENEASADENLTAFEQLFALNSQNNLSTMQTATSDETETLVSSNLKSNNANLMNSEVAEEVANIKENSLSDELEKTNEGIIDEKMLEDLSVEIEDSDTNSSNKESMMNKQSPEEYSVKVMLNGTNKFDINSINTVSKASADTIQSTPDKIMEQITRQMENLQNNSKLNMTLNPGNLGKVNLQITNTNEGLAAQFTVTTNEVRDILMKGVDGLKDTLLAQGVSVDNITVKVQEPEESAYNPDWTEQDGSRGGNKQQEESQGQKDSEKERFEEAMAKQIKLNQKDII